MSSPVGRSCESGCGILNELKFAEVLSCEAREKCITVI